MRARRPNWSGQDVTLLSVLIVLGLTAFAMPCAAEVKDRAELVALLAALTPEDLAALIIQSESDSMRIRELEIQLFWANERTRIAEDEKPNWAERFLARYGLAIGFAGGMWVTLASVGE